jgi:NAD(P)-dependent dehydrogenase (short-subunit alcohol dehydrogenase family)
VAGQWFLRWSCSVYGMVVLGIRSRNGKNRTLRPSKDHSNSKELKASDDLVLIDGDISKKETAIEVAEAAIKHFGRIDLLVNNAGIFIPKPFTEYTEDDYNLVMNTNVASFFFMTQQVIPQMKRQNSGHVVNISAVLADQPSGSVSALLAVLSNSPIPAVSKALALEYAANNIRFNTVSPATSTRRCTPRIIMLRWRSFIPSVGWVKFLTSSTQCSISRTPRS